jgi:hypothetical protein
MSPKSKPFVEADQSQVTAPVRRAGRERPSRSDEVLDLQRKAGNHATAQLLAQAQPTLRVGPAGDRYEREADSVAGQVVAALRSPAAGTPGVGEAERGQAPIARRIQRRGTSGQEATISAEGGELDAATDARIRSAQSGGAPLDGAVRSAMEGAFGTSFDHVRVHAGAEAATLNRQIEAKAFTIGSDIFFDGGLPDTTTRDGQHLLAHELTHTVQQTGGSPAVQRFSLFGKKDKKPTAEQKAKKDEKVEEQRLKGEKELGTKQREQMKEQIGNDPTAQTDLRERFDKALVDEKALRDRLVKAGKDPETAETEAYAQIWLKAPPDLRAIRPMRETRAEKLVSKTTELRSEVDTHKSQDQHLKDSRGSLVSKGVEDLMVKEILLVQEMLKLMVPLDEAKEEAYQTVWAKADPKLVAKRPPRGSKLETKAYEIAEKRAPLHKKHESESDPLGLVANIGNAIAMPTSKVGTGIKVLGDDKNKKTLSTGERVGGGMESIANMVTGVLDSIVGIKDFIVMVQNLTEQKSVDFNDIGMAIKAGLGELGKLNGHVSGAMRIASSLSESALASLADVIPIVDVISNAIAVAGGIADTLPNAMRYGSNLGDVYLARSGERPELVLPLQRLGRRNFQMLEKSFADTTFAITKLSLGIAQVATGGADFGATTAIKYVVQGIQIAHSIGHMVADDVYALQAKGARKEFTAKSEGSAEGLLKKDASYAIDALITAALKGDKKSQWLARGALKDSYGVEFTTGDTSEIAAAHDRILKILKESDDPKTTLDKLKSGIKDIKKTAGGMQDKAVDVNTLAESRNKEDGKKRGFGWKMKMWFKSDGALARRIAQHNVEHGTDLETSKQKKGAKYKSKGEDPNITRPAVQQKLIDEMEDMTPEELQAAAKDPTRTQFERIVFAQAAAEKLKLKMQAATK